MKMGCKFFCELFTLKRCHEEIGEDYDESEDEGTPHLAPKCAKLENDTAITKVGEQIQLDEQLAREIESQLNQEFLQDHQNCDNLTMQERSHCQVEQEKDAEQSTSGQLTTEKILSDHVSVVKELSNRVDDTGQFFIK